MTHRQTAGAAGAGRKGNFKTQTLSSRGWVENGSVCARAGSSRQPVAKNGPDNWSPPWRKKNSEVPASCTLHLAPCTPPNHLRHPCHLHPDKQTHKPRPRNLETSLVLPNPPPHRSSPALSLFIAACSNQALLNCMPPLTQSYPIN